MRLQHAGEQMLQSEARIFTEPSECGAAIRGGNFDVTVTGRGSFAAEFTAIDLGVLRLQRMSGNLPVMYHSSNLDGRANFLFHTRPGPDVTRDGIEISPDKLVRRLDRPQSHSVRSSGPMNWGTISLRLEDIPSASGTVLGFDLTPPKDEQVLTPRPGALANLQRLHAAAGSLAWDAPEIIGNPGAAHGIEQILMQALVACLDIDNAQEATSTQSNHQRIMQRFHAIVRANATQPLYVLEMASAAGASLRSLTVCCQEHLGMGPKKYLMLRRMHLAREALYASNPNDLTVTDVATRFGFWQFGRFAGQYKSMFGESPSTTLRRSATS
jgi:AraC-like DNA-binding protein